MLNTGTIKEIDKTGEKQTVKFFSPLKITTYHPYEYGGCSADDLPEEIPSSEAVRYMDEILAAIEKEKLPNEGNRGLMVYFDKDKALVQKVYGLNPTVEEWNGELWGVMEAEVYGKLTKAETAELVEFSVGQFADGWGESFEQHPIKTQDGEIYVSFWNSKNFFIQPEQELKQNAETDLGCNIQTMGGL
ncbi:hypothetical protein [Faecalispora anaeroviscerum]|uniref:hypothetical protein n=1 Tax=Faecalispora anaeroviscerum TaxID=2991836 RepID=UPI0024BB1721|nr:hypothetical protein [Faecalispora anaeroviscerum]